MSKTCLFQGGMYILVLTPGQYSMVSSSFNGIDVKPTTDKSNGKMSFKLNESQWNMFQANQARAAQSQGECVCEIFIRVRYLPFLDYKIR